MWLSMIDPDADSGQSQEIPAIIGSISSPSCPNSQNRRPEGPPQANTLRRRATINESVCLAAPRHGSARQGHPDRHSAAPGGAVKLVHDDIETTCIRSFIFARPLTGPLRSFREAARRTPSAPCHITKPSVPAVSPSHTTARPYLQRTTVARRAVWRRRSPSGSATTKQGRSNEATWAYPFRVRSHLTDFPQGSDRMWKRLSPRRYWEGVGAAHSLRRDG